MIRYLSCCPAFGFETKSVKQLVSGRKSRNFKKALDLLPIIGMFTGIARVIGHTNQQYPQKNSLQHRVRGLLAATNLGFLFIGIPDLILTIHRQVQLKKQIAANNRQHVV